MIKTSSHIRYSIGVLTLLLGVVVPFVSAQDLLPIRQRCMTPVTDQPISGSIIYSRILGTNDTGYLEYQRVTPTLDLEPAGHEVLYQSPNSPLAIAQLVNETFTQSQLVVLDQKHQIVKRLDHDVVPFYGGFPWARNGDITVTYENKEGQPTVEFLHWDGNTLQERSKSDFLYIYHPLGADIAVSPAGTQAVYPVKFPNRDTTSVVLADLVTDEIIWQTGNLPFKRRITDGVINWAPDGELFVYPHYLDMGGYYIFMYQELAQVDSGGHETILTDFNRDGIRYGLGLTNWSWDSTKLPVIVLDYKGVDVTAVTPQPYTRLLYIWDRTLNELVDVCFSSQGPDQGYSGFVWSWDSRYLAMVQAKTGNIFILDTQEWTYQTVAARAYGGFGETVWEPQ